ncbi:MAG: YncE family protein, partial [Myxococcales bacterium]
MTRKCCWTLALLVAVSIGAPAARAGDGGRNGGAVKLLTTVPIPSTAKEPNHLVVFDISFVDPATQLYYLADRSDKAIDVVDAKRNVFVKQIRANFKGFTGSNDTSGPNGVVVSGHFLFVTDANSRVVSIDLRTDKVISDVSTGGAPGLRADELAYDPQDGVLLPVNNADSPPFATLIKVDKQTGKLTVGTRITFKEATNGAEQPVWDAALRRFFISIPELNGDGGSGPDGAVGVINPNGTSGTPEKFLPVKFCQPAGLALGPNQDLLLGCSVVFDTAGKQWSASDPNTAAPTQMIMDARSGKIDSVVKGVGGSDE